jgi:hypothetical protein
MTSATNAPEAYQAGASNVYVSMEVNYFDDLSQTVVLDGELTEHTSRYGNYVPMSESCRIPLTNPITSLLNSAECELLRIVRTASCTPQELELSMIIANSGHFFSPSEDNLLYSELKGMC